MNSQPGESDMSITRKNKESGNVKDIQLLDHLIILLEVACYGMADEGML
jgi:DNA repair protein RadC